MAGMQRWMRDLGLWVGLGGSLSACHHFVGEEGELGFVSNLVAAGGQPWTPVQPIAAGARVEVLAAARLDGREAEGLDAPAVEGAVTGAVSLISSGAGSDLLVFTGSAGSRGAAVFWGETSDRFPVRFAAAEAVVLRGLADEAAGVRARPGVALVPGATVPLVPELSSAAGEVLGWPRQALVVDGEGAISAWLDEQGTLWVSADGESGEEGLLHLAVEGVGTWSVPVEIAVPELSMTTSLWQWASPEGEEEEEVSRVVAESLLDDETRLYGLPLRWEGAEASVDQPDVARRTGGGEVSAWVGETCLASGVE